MGVHFGKKLRKTKSKKSKAVSLIKIETILCKVFYFEIKCILVKNFNNIRIIRLKTDRIYEKVRIRLNKL
jgi:hypothetical protein